MSIIAGVLRNRPSVLLRLGLILLLPWIWAVYLMPMWASALCGGLWLIAFFLGARTFVAPMFARRRAGDNLALSPDQMIKMRGPEAGFNIETFQGEMGLFHGQLGKWRGSSKYSSSKAAHAKKDVGEVITQTEQAVLALTTSFRGITTKTRQQMDTAMSLLRRNADQVNISEGGWLSLPDYIRAYDTQLQEVI